MAPLLSINCATDDSRPAYSELRGLRGRGWRMDAPEAKEGNERERGGSKEGFLSWHYTVG